MEIKEKTQHIVPIVILSDAHEKLGNTYVPYNNLRILT